jgi:hypothetical protein
MGSNRKRRSKADHATAKNQATGAHAVAVGTLFDREEIPEMQKHLVWVGRGMDRVRKSTCCTEKARRQQQHGAQQ